MRCNKAINCLRSRADKIGQRGIDGLFGDAPDALVHPLGVRGQVDPLDAAVVARGAALDPAIGDQPVDHAPGGGLFHLHHLGKLGKRCAGAPVQAGQDQPLRARDAEAADAAVEFGPQQPRHVRNHHTNIFVGIWHRCGCSHRPISKLG